MSKGGVERTVVRIASAAGAGCNLSKAIGEGLEGDVSCKTSYVTRHTLPESGHEEHRPTEKRGELGQS